MTGTSTPSYRHPEHPWVTRHLETLRSNLENDVYNLAERLSKMARDYDAMQERNRTLQAENAELRKVLALCDPDGERLVIRAPEDARVRALCDELGYGAVMDSAARQWRRKDSVGAHTVGPCVGTVQGVLRR